MTSNAKPIFHDLNLVLRLNQHIEALTATEAGAAALLQRASSFQVLTELSSIETPDPRDDAQFDHQRLVTLHRDAEALPFHLQGDATFNEASALARRRHLRHSDDVKTQIQFLWQVARGRDAVVSTPAVATITEREYTDMMLLIFKVLRDDFVVGTAQLQIQCDWAVDSHHGEVLAYDQFFAALFELVDVWTCDMLETTYSRFLQLLARRITVRVVVFLDDQKLKLALSDNFDDAVVVQAIPLSTIKQFASVAKVLEGSGVRTVGELATADPRTVETQRVAYLNRHAIAPEKIGDDLAQLLKMFREISAQIQHANSALDNMVLQRMPPKREVGGRGGGDDRDGKSPQISARVGVDMGVRGEGSLSAWTDSSHSHRSGGDGDPGSRQDSIHGERSSRFQRGSGYSSSPRSEGDPSESRQGSIHGDRRMHSSSDGWDATQYSDRRSLGSSPGTEANTNATTHPGGITRIHTFRDISVTETSVLDALKASFLIEKGISLQRQSSLRAIKAELIKFGIDPTGMDEAAIQEKYQQLYENFVLRDGDNIKALAVSVLTRIKLELALHGINVDEGEDMEAMYDGFYGTVVAGSGDRMVADAKSWVDETVDAKSYGAYLKQEYHELKSIDEVVLIGGGVEDEEFVSLLSKDDDGDHESGDVVGATLESVVGKTAVAPLSRRPTLYRGLSDSLQKDTDPSDCTVGIKRVTALLTAENSDGDISSSTDQPSEPSEELRAVEDATAIQPNLPTDAESAHDPVNELTDTSAEVPSVVDADAEKPSAEAVEEVDELVPIEEAIGEETIRVSLEDTDIHTIPIPDAIVNGAENAENLKMAIEDERSKRSRVATFKPSNIKTVLFDAEGVATSNGNHDHLHEVNRESQGIGFGYDETVDPVTVDIRVTTPARPITREPKFLDIVVGGIDTGKNSAVTARYIQLLGLGNVLTIAPETELMARLQSSTKASIDLLIYDVGEELDTAVAKAQELVALVGRRVIFLGGDTQQPEKTDVVARLCVTEGGILCFRTTPIDFPTLRTEIQAFIDAAPDLYISRQRRVTGVFGAAAKLVTTTVRATHTSMMCNEDDHPRSALSPPRSVDFSSAKRKASAISTPALTALLPHLATPRRETFSPFRPVRLIDEMPGAEAVAVTPTRYTPIVPSSHPQFKSKGKSPRVSAALRKLMR